MKEKIMIQGMRGNKEEQLVALKDRQKSGERIVSLMASEPGIIKIGEKDIETNVLVTVGYVLTDSGVRERYLTIGDESDQLHADLHMQGQKLEKVLPCGWKLLPIEAVIHYADPVGPKNELIGWYIETEEGKQNAWLHNDRKRNDI